jgi:hypothetical protein
MNRGFISNAIRPLQRFLFWWSALIFQILFGFLLGVFITDHFYPDEIVASGGVLMLLIGLDSLGIALSVAHSFIGGISWYIYAILFCAIVAIMIMNYYFL